MNTITDFPSDKSQIVDIVTTIGPKIDNQDWNGVLESFAPVVDLDYSSLFGGESEQLAAKEIIRRWSSLTPGFDSTKHLIQNESVEIDGDGASAKSHVIGTHTLVNPLYENEWVIEGHYYHQLRKIDGQWKIISMRLEANREEGNREIISLALARREAQLNAKGHYRAAISFPSEDNALRGTLFIPSENLKQEHIPMYLVTGSWSSVKEQNPEEYASRLSDNGSFALTFDHTGFGESEGVVRQFENPFQKVRDIRSALDFIDTLKNIDRSSIIGLGICAGAGYMAKAASEDPRIQKLITVAGWFTDKLSLEGFFGSDALKFLQDMGDRAEKNYSTNGTIDYMLATVDPSKYSDPKDVPAAAMPMPEAAAYYDDNERFAFWKNEWAEMSFAKILKFESIPAADTITVPTLLVHSEQAIAPGDAERFFKSLEGIHKKAVWLKADSQFDFYDNAETITNAVDEIIAWN